MFKSRQTRFKKERYLIRQDNTIYKFLIKNYFSSIEQDKSVLLVLGVIFFKYRTREIKATETNKKVIYVYCLVNSPL